jgi:hypothetical protein
MVNVLREVIITIHVETNKTTYKKDFDNIDEAKEYLEDILENLD